MKRREFLQNSAAAISAAGITGLTPRRASAAGSENPAREFYELRLYQIPNAEMHQVVDDYLRHALVPALGRMGIQRIGVFAPIAQEDQDQNHSIFVLIPDKSLEMVVRQRDLLVADEEYLAAAETYYAQPEKQPAYRRINSRLLRAFVGMPVMELPPETDQDQPRIFELRIYESHNEDAARRKVEMFNQGEIQLMRDVGLGPVMYGETLIGDNVPNLTYMLSASDMEAHQAHWKAFIDHPEWKRMKQIERYQGTVSNITKYYLKPTEYSQM
ncbi:MAG: NIPSNAP family protein [Planctomycetota bacterium]